MPSSFFTLSSIGPTLRTAWRILSSLVSSVRAQNSSAAGSSASIFAGSGGTYSLCCFFISKTLTLAACLVEGFLHRGEQVLEDRSRAEMQLARDLHAGLKPIAAAV